MRTISELRSLPALSSWLSAPAAETFPYDAVVDAYLRVGKHFVDGELLDALDEARSLLPGIQCAARSRDQLARFLDVALDKRDKRYDYATYLGLSLLPLPCGGPGAALQRRHDRLFTHLIADVARFELETLDGVCDLLPQMRPDDRLRAKRLRLVARVLQPALGRLGTPFTVPGRDNVHSGPDPAETARDLITIVTRGMTGAERRTLRLTMLPVWVAHDEYMFIRVLQAFETTFALLAGRMRLAIEALADDRPDAAAGLIGASERSLSEAARAFSLMATMQIESFRTFRQYTEGASAIQSGNYKILESLCASPSRSRLDSPAYLSVPEVRKQVVRGHVNLDDMVAAGIRDGRLSPGAQARLIPAMLGFESALLQWRQTHYRLAVRMLGDRTGTGYTEGTPYLRDARNIRVFSVGRLEPAAQTEASAPSGAAGIAVRGRNPGCAIGSPPVPQPVPTLRHMKTDVAAMTYGELIRTEELRCMQQEIPGAPDGRFFVAAHQVTELWFTIILHELSLARDCIDADDLAGACYRLARVARGEDVLVCHLRAVETISPGNFLTVRVRLGSSSAYESAQFREIEFLSGLKDPRYLDSEKLTAAERQRLEARLAEPSLRDSFEALLARRGRPDLAAVVGGSQDAPLRALIDALLDHDHGFARWRHAHALMAERVIGYKPGTGGSSGVTYLQATTATRFFPQLWEIHSAL